MEEYPSPLIIVGRKTLKDTDGIRALEKTVNGGKLR